MKTILSIFRNDIRSIFKHIFVLVIILVMGFMPSLYAWINIYANWDPYVNTGNVEVAVASRDTGIDLTDGTHINRADEIIAEIQDDTDIKYRPLDDPDEAIESVESGRYYAAIVFEEGFTYDMEHYEDAMGDEDAKITYYPNIKKNAVATKITDGVSENLLELVNKEYLETVFARFFEDANAMADTLDSSEAVDDALAQLVEARNALHDYNLSLELFLNSSGDISSALKSTKNHLDAGKAAGRAEIAKAKKAYKQTAKDLKSVSKAFKEKSAEIDKTMDALAEIIEALKQPIDEEARQILVEKAEELSDEILVHLQALRALIPGNGNTAASKIAASTLDLMIEGIEGIKDDLDKPSRIDAVAQQLKALIQMNNEELLPVMKLMVTDIKKAVRMAKPLLSSTVSVIGTIDPFLNASGKTVSSLDKALLRLHGTLGPLEDALDNIIEKVEAADEDDRAGILIDLLGGDPDKYTSYFTSPVEISSTTFYPVQSYGEAMTPFYTIIALWVGGVMLITLLKVKVNRRKFPDATEAQCYIGRYLIMFLIGQIQAAVVVAGDIFLLHCQPVHPFLMWLSASVTSMVFVLLIYSLVLSFGHVGRALVIVIMILQIAGSSGSYPIEILPVVFAKIYKFFPFPYAINAMREALCGLYGADFLMYLGQLLIFAVVAVLIGLLIRRPFIGMDRYVTDKLEETEVL